MPKYHMDPVFRDNLHCFRCVASVVMETAQLVLR